MLRKTSLLILLLLLAAVPVSAAAWGETWKWNEFNADYEKFYYEIISGSTSWDWELEEDVWVESTSYQLLEVTKIDDESWMVTQAQTSRMTKDELEGLSFMGGLSGLMALMGGNWFSEFMVLGMFASDLEFEVGNTMQLSDGSRVRVVEEQKVAGVDGFLARKLIREEDEEGNRRERVTSEWIIAPDVGWPLAVKVFDSDGNLTYSMTLLEYERR